MRIKPAATRRISSSGRQPIKVPSHYVFLLITQEASRGSLRTKHARRPSLKYSTAIAHKPIHNSRTVRCRDQLDPIFRQAIAHVASARYLALLCETQKIAGAVEDALVTVEQALQASPEVLIYRPELLRLRALLNLQKDSESHAHFGQAERDFRKAIEVAQGMGAKSIQLICTTSFARLLAKQGRHAEARMMLAEIYNWFTEGFDTADLINAKALLDELGRS